MTADYYIFIILILSHRHFKMWHHKSKMAARRGDKPCHSGTTVESKQHFYKATSFSFFTINLNFALAEFQAEKSLSSGSENIMFQPKISEMLPQTQLGNVPVSLLIKCLVVSCKYVLKCCLNKRKYPNVLSKISSSFTLSNVERRTQTVVFGSAAF